MAEKSTLARPYAQAMFELASEQKRLNEWSIQLAALRDVVTHAQVKAVTGNPNVARDQAVEFLLDILGDRLDEFGKNAVKVLVENHRLNLVPEIAAHFEVLRAEAEKTINAEVITAYPVESQHRDTLIEALKKRFGRDVTLSTRTDESIIGGAIIRAGDVVIDGSVTGQLARLTHAITG